MEKPSKPLKDSNQGIIQGVDPTKDYYKILGLQEGASLEKIKARWVELKKQFPSGPKDENEAATLKQINEAYQALKRSVLPSIEFDVEKYLKEVALSRSARREKRRRKIIFYSSLLAICLIVSAVIFILERPQVITQLASIIQDDPNQKIQRPIEKSASLPSPESQTPLKVAKVEPQEPSKAVIPEPAKPAVPPAPPAVKSVPPVEVTKKVVPPEPRKTVIPEPAKPVPTKPPALKATPPVEVTKKGVPPEPRKTVVPEPAKPAPAPPPALRPVPPVEVARVIPQEPSKAVTPEAAKPVPPPSPVEVARVIPQEPSKAVVPEAAKPVPPAPPVEVARVIPQEPSKAVVPEAAKPVPPAPPVEVAKVVPPPKPAPPPPPSGLATEGEIRQFLGSYVNSYNNKSTEGFISFFSPRAIQNQKDDLARIRKTYDSFFDQMESVQYRVTINRIETRQNTAEVRAQYELDGVLVKGRKTQSWKGQVRWVLVKEDGALKIISLDYQPQK